MALMLKLIFGVGAVGVGVYTFDPLIREYCKAMKTVRERRLAERSAAGVLEEGEREREEAQIARLGKVAASESLWAYWRDNAVEQTERLREEQRAQHKTALNAQAKQRSE